MELLVSLWQEQRWRVILGLVGVVMVGVGVWQMGVQSQGNEVIVETPDTSNPSLNSGQSQILADNEEVVVDVGGAVEKPGLYRLPAGIRVGEVVEEAGGLTDEANREWVGKMMNLADVVKDGGKIYIPFINDEENVKSGGVAGATIINVNTASVGELDSLWGIGAVRAQAIIDNRPYGSIDEVKEKAGIPENVMEANEGKWGIY